MLHGSRGRPREACIARQRGIRAYTLTYVVRPERLVFVTMVEGAIELSSRHEMIAPMRRCPSIARKSMYTRTVQVSQVSQVSDMIILRIDPATFHCQGILLASQGRSLR